MFNLELSFLGAERIEANLGKTKLALEKLATPLTMAGDLLLQDFQANFDSHGDLYGGWAGLALSTYEEKAKKGYSPYTLVGTGAMKESFRARLVSSGNFVEMQLMNTADYFKYHQSSAPRSGKLPRRVMMKIRDQMAKDLIALFAKFAATAIKENNG